ncbi:MAG: FHIPEP family type III secretion protein [Lachnospiraceae bacterium]|nr:FHIPEP family type III secretion protein [Lachnospiraceae bacterium]
MRKNWKRGDADAYRKMIDNVSTKCQEYYADILNKQIVKIMIDNIKEFFLGVVVGLVPEKIGYLQVQRKLQKILREGKSIRDMLHILEELEEAL